MDDHNQSRYPRVRTQSKTNIKHLKEMRSTIQWFPLPPFPHLRAAFQKSPLWIVKSLDQRKQARLRYSQLPIS
jgi:hypothetical protein